MGLKPGMTNNPDGRPVSETTLLRNAIKGAQQYHRLTILEHFIERAYINDNVLKAVMNKIAPDLKSLDINALVASVSGEMTREEAKEIRGKLLARFSGTIAAEEEEED